MAYRFLKRLWNRPNGEQSRVEASSGGMAENSRPVAEKRLSGTPPTDPTQRVGWNMEVYCKHATEANRRRAHKALTSREMREMKKPHTALAEVLERVGTLNPRELKSIDTSIERFLECVATSFCLHAFGRMEGIDRKENWKSAALLLSPAVPQDKLPKIEIEISRTQILGNNPKEFQFQTLEIDNPYNWKLLKTMSKLCTSDRKAKAINHSKLTSNLVKLLDCILTANQRTLSDLTIDLDNKEKDLSPPQKSVQILSRSRGNQVQSFLAEESDEEDEVPAEEKEKKSSKITHLQICQSSISTIVEFLCQLSRFKSTGIVMIRSNTLDLLMNLIFSADTDEHPMCVGGKLVASRIVKTLASRGLDNVSELSNYLDNRQLAKLMEYLEAEIGFKHTSSRNTFATSSSSLVRPKFSGKDIIGTRAEIIVHTLSATRSLLHHSQSHKLYTEFKDASGYEIFLDAADWLSKVDEKSLQSCVEGFDGSIQGDQNLKIQFLSELLKTVAEFVFSGPEALSLPKEKLEVIAFDPSNRTQDMVGIDEGLDSLRVRNLDAFRVLMKLFSMIQLEGFKIEALNRILMTFSSHPDNYWILYPLDVTKTLIKSLPYFSEQVRGMVMKIVESVAIVVQAVPFQELTSLSVVLSDLDSLSRKSAGHPRTPRSRKLSQHPNFMADIASVIMETTINFIKHDKDNSKLVGKCGMLDVIFMHICNLQNYLKLTRSRKGRRPRNAVVGPEQAELASGIPVLQGLTTYNTFLDSLQLILENPSNLKLFRESKCHMAVMDLPSYPKYREKALKILSVPADGRGLSDMLELLHLTTHRSETSRQVAIMDVLCTMITSVEAKDLWRNLTGFECMYTMLTRLQGSFADEKLSEVECSGKLSILLSIFGVLTFSIKDYAINRLHLWSSEAWKSLAAALRMTSISKRPDLVRTLTNTLIALSTEDLRYFDKDETGIKVEMKKQSLLSPQKAKHKHTASVTTQDIDSKSRRRSRRVVISKKDIKKGPVLSIKNPKAILILLDLTETADISNKIHTLSCIYDLLKDSPESLANVEALTSVNFFAYLVHYFPIFGLRHSTNLSDILGDDSRRCAETELRALTIRLLLLVGAHRLSALELKLLIHIFPQPLLKQIMLRMACGQATANFVELGTIAGPTAYIEIPSVLSRETGWIHEGFSISMWINLRSVNPNTRVQIFRLETTREIMCHFLILNKLLRIYGGSKAGPTKLLASFDTVKFDMKRWYHIALVYDNRPRRAYKRNASFTDTNGKETANQCGSLKLYIDGKEAETAIVQSGLPISSTSMNATAILGCPPENSDSANEIVRSSIDVKTRHLNNPNGVLWWIGPTIMTHGMLSKFQVEMLYAKGFNSKSTFHPKRVGMERKGALAHNSIIFVFNAKDSLGIREIEELKKAVNLTRARGSSAKLSLESKRVKREEKKWHYHESDPQRLLSNLRYSALTKVGKILVNTVVPPQDSKTLVMPMGILHGGASCISPLNIADSLRSVSGIHLLFPPIAHCKTTAQLNDALTLLAVTLHGNAKNKRMMMRIEGYKLLAQILIEKASMLTGVSLDVIFSMVEDRCPGKGTATVCCDRDKEVYTVCSKRESWKNWSKPTERTIVNMEAVLYLLLDWDIWRQTPSRLQAAVFARLAQLCLWGPKHEATSDSAFANAVRMQESNTLAHLLHTLQENGRTMKDEVIDALSALLEATLVHTSSTPPDIGALASYLAAGLSDQVPANESEMKTNSASSLLKKASGNLKYGFLLMETPVPDAGLDTREMEHFPMPPKVKMGFNILNILTGLVVRSLEAPSTTRKLKVYQLLTHVLNKKFFGMFLSRYVYPQIVEALICLGHVMLCAPKVKDASALSRKILHTMTFFANYIVPSWPIYTSLLAILIGKVSEAILSRCNSMSILRSKERLLGLAMADKKDQERMQRQESLSAAFDVFVLSTDLMPDSLRIDPRLEVIALLLHIIELNSMALLQPLITMEREKVVSSKPNLSLPSTRLPVTAARFFNLMVHQNDVLKKAMWYAPEVRSVSNPASSTLASGIRGTGVQQLIRIWYALFKQQKLASDIIGKAMKKDKDGKRGPSATASFRPPQHKAKLSEKDLRDFHENPFNARILASSEILESIGDLLCTLLQEVAMNSKHDAFCKYLENLMYTPEGVTLAQRSVFNHMLHSMLMQKLKGALTETVMKNNPQLLVNMNQLATFFIGHMNSGVITPQLHPRIDLRTTIGMARTDAKSMRRKLSSGELEPGASVQLQRTRENYFICRVVDFVIHVLQMSLINLASKAKFLNSKVATRAILKFHNKKSGFIDLSKEARPIDARTPTRVLGFRQRGVKIDQDAEWCQTARDNAMLLLVLAIHDYGSNPDIICFLFSKMSESKAALCLFKREVVETKDGTLMALDVKDNMFYSLCSHLHQHLKVSEGMQDIVQIHALEVWKKLLKLQRPRTELVMTSEDSLEVMLDKTAKQRHLLDAFERLVTSRDAKTFGEWFSINGDEVDRVFNKTLGPHMASFLQNRARSQGDSKSSYTKKQMQSLSQWKESKKKIEDILELIDKQRKQIISARQHQEIERQKVMAHYMLHRRIKMRGMYHQIATNLLHQTQAVGPFFSPFIQSYPASKKSVDLYHHFLPMTVIDPYDSFSQSVGPNTPKSPKESDRGDIEKFAPPVHDGVRMPFALDHLEGPSRTRRRMIGHEKFYSVYGIDQTLMLTDKKYEDTKETRTEKTFSFSAERVESDLRDSSEQSALMAASKRTADILKRAEAKKKLQPLSVETSNPKSLHAFRKAARKSVHMDIKDGRISLSSSYQEGEKDNIDDDSEDEGKDEKKKETKEDKGKESIALQIDDDLPKKKKFKIPEASGQEDYKEGQGMGSDASLPKIITDRESDSQWVEILMLLPPGEENSIVALKNCSRISGLSKHDGVLLIGNSRMFLIDNYKMDGNEVIPITEMGEELKVEQFYFMRPCDHSKDTDRDEITPPVLEVVKIRDKEKYRKPQGYHIEDRHKLREYRYSDIVEMRKRRYQLQKVAIEIFSAEGESELLTFSDKRDREEVFSKLYSSGVHSTLNDIRVGLPPTVRQQPGQTLLQSLTNRARSITQQWQDGEISNFTYLMYLNTIAGRSYNDLTQYPVFPWVIKNYKSDTIDLKDENNYRDLSKPMGAIGEKRKKKFIDRFNNWEDPSGIIPKFHYGTHYASAATTLYYLLRLEPFTRIGLQLQGGKFDHADRLFYSIQHSWHSSSSDGGLSDVKELIPEFYYLPDFLRNSNRFDLGVTQWKQVVHDVELPPWAKGDPRRFVKIMRRALESDVVSKSLHNWIDLIFGYKQQGKPAAEAQNVFYYLTYEDKIDIDAIEDEVDKMSVIAQINNFGQTPQQLFKRPHPSRKTGVLQVTLSSHANILIPTKEYHQKLRLAVYDIHCVADEKLSFACGKSALIPPKYKMQLQWGHADNSLWFTSDHESWNTSMDRVIAVHEDIHDGQISCVKVTSGGKHIVTAGEDAKIMMWEMPSKGKESQPLNLVASLTGHSSRITCMILCEEYQLIVSGSTDGQVILWDLKRKLLQCRLPRHPGPIVGIAIDRGSGNIVTTSGSWLFVWNVNGDLCAVRQVSESQTEDVTSVAVAAGSDVQIDKDIITGHKDGKIQFWRLELPDLTDKKHWESDFNGFNYQAPVRDCLCVRDDIPGTVYRFESSNQGMSTSTEAKEEKKRYRRNMRRDVPYMVLVPVEKRRLHSTAITCIHSNEIDLQRMVSADAGGNVIMWKIKNDEHWVQDYTVTACTLCQKPFGVLERRHHCRDCGKIFCNGCSTHKARIPKYGYADPVRVCDTCYTELSTNKSGSKQ